MIRVVSLSLASSRHISIQLTSILYRIYFPSFINATESFITNHIILFRVQCVAGISSSLVKYNIFRNKDEGIWQKHLKLCPQKDCYAVPSSMSLISMHTEKAYIVKGRKCTHTCTRTHKNTQSPTRVRKMVPSFLKHRAL